MLHWKSIVSVGALALCSAVASGALAAAPKGASAAPEVIMYATQTCGYCVRARAWLEARNVAWDERDIERSESAHKEWTALGGVGTPVIVINGKAFTGFAEASLDAELAKLGH
jgi:glutaredoxin